MAPKYKLTYFPIRGLGETTRLIFVAAGVEYEDVRIKGNWAELKPKTPMGQLPTLEVDGVTLCQSKAVARFVAMETGLAGRTHLEQAQADMFADEIDELLKNLVFTVMTYDAAEQAEKAKKLDKAIPEHLDKLEKLSGSNGHLLGDSLLWCDLMFFNLGFSLDQYKPGTLKNFPKLTRVMDIVKANERIAAWVAKRPEAKV